MIRLSGSVKLRCAVGSGLARAGSPAPVQPDRQELGRRAARPLRKGPQFIRTTTTATGLIGSTVDSWLREDGIYEDVGGAAIKRVLTRQVEAAMKEEHVSKAEMARRTPVAPRSIASCNYEAVTLNTLRKAATAVGRELRLELI
jgi:hypothetical protein